MDVTFQNDHEHISDCIEANYEANAFNVYANITKYVSILECFWLSGTYVYILCTCMCILYTYHMI